MSTESLRLLLLTDEVEDILRADTNVDADHAMLKSYIYQLQVASPKADGLAKDRQWEYFGYGFENNCKQVRFLAWD